MSEIKQFEVGETVYYVGEAVFKTTIQQRYGNRYTLSGPHVSGLVRTDNLARTPLEAAEIIENTVIPDWKEEADRMREIATEQATGDGGK